MEDKQDRPGVVVLPPLLMLGAVILVLGLHYFWPLQVGARVLTIALGVGLCVVGLGGGIWGNITLVKTGTNVSPLKPTTAIVSGGPYRFTRNPLYVGMMIVFVGISLLVGTWWGLIVLVPVFAILHYGVVLLEERYLERKFGQPYLAYKNAVRRYL